MVEPDGGPRVNVVVRALRAFGSTGSALWVRGWRGRRARLALTLVALLAVAAWVGTAGAERAQRENVIAMINGGIKPRKLPRDKRVPVTVFLSGGVQTSDGSPIPRVNWIRLELAWRGAMNTHGLPVCPRQRLTSTTTKQALRACGDSLVGRGQLSAQIFVPNQPAFRVRANLLTFNGRSKNGHPAVWAHAYSMNPPSSFVIPFTVRNEEHRTVLVTTIRRSVGPWPHVASFQVKVSRIYNHAGDRKSYLMASCPVPKGFSAGFLSFARATYSFAGGEKIITESVRSCRVR
jgi:hypothetical protein